MGEAAIHGQRDRAEWRLPFLFRMLNSAREIGRPKTVAHYAKKIEDDYSEILDTEQADIVKSAKTWVEWATKYERVHGKESLLDRSRPTHLRALEMLGMSSANAA